MNLKQRFSLTFSLLFSIILATLLLVLFTLFSNYRKIEIQNRLVEKAQTTVKLLLEVKAVDYTLLKLIDRNTINNLYNEKTLVFNDSLGLIYSSIDDAVINWDTGMLKRVEKEGYLYKTENEYDIVGKKITNKGKDYIVLISAEDKFGNRNLVFLRYLVIVAFLAGLILVWFLSFYFSKQALVPLDVFKSRVQQISENNLSTRLKTTGKKDEISELTVAFNTMIERIDKSFQYQKSFVGSASHELRTPLSKLSAQLENLMHNDEFPPRFIKTLTSMNQDIQQLSDIVTSLLILSRLENEQEGREFPIVRIDEIIFSSADFLSKYYSDFKIHFEIVDETEDGGTLEIKGDEALLKIALSNLLKNAYMYSDNKEVEIKIVQQKNNTRLFITNTGKTPEGDDTEKLFATFVRGSNAIPNQGFGLGLSIVKRIIQYHKAEIHYRIPAPAHNQMEILFRI